MKNKKSLWWIVVVIALPFVIMLGLHIGIALENYFHININVPNIYAADWFMFYSSYLGGSMTLVGVMITLRHERNVHQYENTLEKIEKEKEKIGKAICGFNLLVPGALYLQVNELLVLPTEVNISEITAIRLRVNEEMHKVLIAKSKLEFSTDIYFMPGKCASCKKPCGLQVTIPELVKAYDTIGDKIYGTLSKINDYIIVSERNLKYRSIGCEDKIEDTKPFQEEIDAAIDEIAQLNQNEIHYLKVLGRNYIEQKCQNAYKKCFPVKEE